MNLKPSLLTLAILTLTAAGSASGQSSLTVFGVIDVGLRHVDNAGTTQYQMSTDGLQSSRLGFRGIEDLGGGLSAGFWLESAVSADTGTANSTRFWHRRATVSLSSTTLGELRLGRDLVPTWTAMADFDPFGTVGIGDTGRLISLPGGVDTQIRDDNMVSYFIPAMGGFYGQLSAAASEGVAGKKYFGGRGGFRNGPIDVTLAYGQTKVTTDDVKLGVVSGSYDFGMVKVMVSAQQVKYQADKDRHYFVGATVPVGLGLIRAAYTKVDGSGPGIGDRDAHQFAIGYVYNLSKRTAVYGTYAQIENKGTANYTVGNISGFTMPATEKDSKGFEMGLRHSF
ncbi:MAG: porin [Burkholderiales bacterium]|jgi:predicted porin|nr:porin [Burkholderiales bacterium]